MTATTTTPPAVRPASPSPTGIAAWIDFALLAFMLTNLAWSLASAQWSPGLEQLFPVVILAVSAGTVVARSNFRELFGAIYSVIVGSAAILFSLARLAPADLTGQERIYHILRRTWTWFQAAFSPQPLADNLAFVLMLAVLLWVLAFSAAWSYFREHHKWQAILPTGLAMLVNLYYAPARLNTYFVLYLFCAILLVVRATLNEREGEWRQSHVFFPYDISFDFMRDGVLFALFVIITAWALPSAAGQGKISPLLDPLQKPWHQFQKEWDQLFSTFNYNRAVGVPSFGVSLALEGPRSVSDALVMEIDTPFDRYYRAVVYDTYLPGGWVLHQSLGISLDDPPFSLPTYKARRLITQTITTYLPGSVLFAAPQPQSVALAADARALLLTPAQDAPPTSPQGEYAMLIARTPLRPGDSYVVRSAITEATIAELRAAGDTYPQSIRERYLQLPDSVPQRVFDLSEKIVAGLDTPYDKAKAIETHLRRIPYNDQIPGPAPNQDAVDYFLFQERQGYCNYYASAMAVMLRHLGIPARLAAGYATGEYQEATGLYRIRDKDSHTWVEVYFPAYGWIEFEPTASEPTLQRRSGANDSTANGGSSGSHGNPDKESRLPLPDEPIDLQRPTPSFWLHRHGGMLLLIGSLLGILLIAIWSARSLRPSPHRSRPVFRTVPPGFISRMWIKTLHWGRRLGIPAHPSLTPYEHAQRLAHTVPQTHESIRTIVELYVRDQYSPYEITPEDASNAQHSWLELRAHLWRNWLRRHIRLPAGLRRIVFHR